MINQTIQSLKPNPEKRAVTSLILGIIGMLFTIVFAYFIVAAGISMGILFGAFLVSSFGLSFGITGLRSMKKQLAILGIILCMGTLILILKIFFYGP